MNFKWDKKYLYWGVTAFCVIAASALFAISIFNYNEIIKLIENIFGIFMPFIYGFAFAYLLSPVMNFFEKKCFRVLFKKAAEKRYKKNGMPTDEERLSKEFKIIKKSRTLGVAASMICAIAVLVGLLSAVLPQIVETITSIGNNSPEYLKQVNILVSDLLKDYPEAEDAVKDFIKNFTTYLTDFLRTSILPQASDIVSNVSSGIMNTLGALLNVVIGFIMCIYLLHGKELFAAQAKKLLYSFLSLKNANLILRNTRQVHKTFGSFITGKLIDSLIVGIIFFIIFSIFDFPYVVLISVILCVTNIIPYFGPFIGAIPSAFLILLVDPIKCVYFFIIVLIVQQIDGNVLDPKIQSNNTGLSSFWIIFSLILGQSLFGFIGLIITIPFFAVAYSIIRARVSKRLEKKGFPSDSNTYRELAYIDKDNGVITTLEQLKEREDREKEILQKERAKKNSKKRNRNTKTLQEFLKSKKNDKSGKDD